MGIFFNKKQNKQNLVEFSFLDLLPIGTIIKIKEKSNKFMILSYLDNGDYLVALYPIGNTLEQEIIQISKNDIEDVVYKGYDSSERKEFLTIMDSIKE